ncbi:glycoside hydrolase family 3 protein [Pseudoroseicyclus aestuarii]|uniref:beta-glucosidase n=1 Tax=Pseudoroseicyclus aestuarii TaxID=1795041 RepID=A0A318ST90_9RHOB|nr:glycoside hydrolase family 3 N-terminal domain-containing protein [Pseudoroseicyclus aestuarii]PYE84682.1 beta-glucosidase [Pseudoroseicyclus aestuarii]
MTTGRIITLAICLPLAGAAWAQTTPRQPQIETRGALPIEVDGLTFRDLDRSGDLTPYEDWRLPDDQRVADLLSRMTLEEKAGVMMHGTAPAQSDESGTDSGQSYDLEAARALIEGDKVNTFITRLAGEAAHLAEQNNALQEIAEGTRLGIPATISTDPRNAFQYTEGASVAPGSFSQWPETTGLAALDDPALTRAFADMARQEYRAVGIHQALSPQADLATEPRWSRVNGTFGEDPQRARAMVKAYVAGFQNGEGGLDEGSVITTVKHWVGYGAAPEGFDSHNAYARTAQFTGDNLGLHVIPFEGAFEAHVGAVMPTYSILEGLTVNGQPLEEVAAGYNAQLLTDLLRGRHRFDGVILTDWLITRDCRGTCLTGWPEGESPRIDGDFGIPWGVEEMAPVDRYAKAVEAGVDQFGGVSDSALLVQAVAQGKIEESRIDESVTRILGQKFALGLFEAPFVAPAQAAQIVGSDEFTEAGLDAQARSTVLLKNDGTLPLDPAQRSVWLHGIDAGVAEAAGFTVVDDLAQADLALIRADAPYEHPHADFFFGSIQQEGRLNFVPGDAGYDAYLEAQEAGVPAVMTVTMNRPAVLADVQEAAALMANFGQSDEALMQVLTGAVAPEGSLPFELPASMAAVEAQAPDLPYDSRAPLYAFGAGMSY